MPHCQFPKHIHRLASVTQKMISIAAFPPIRNYHTATYRMHKAPHNRSKYFWLVNLHREAISIDLMQRHQRVQNITKQLVDKPFTHYHFMYISLF